MLDAIFVEYLYVKANNNLLFKICDKVRSYVNLS